jgi:hypothetical protein
MTARNRRILTAAVLLFSLSGCAGWNLHDEPLTDNELSQSVRKARPQKKSIEYWSFSEKGRQVERDLPPM